MRKSTSSFKSRLALAGISAGAVAAALLVAPSAAYAVDLGGSTPGGGPAGLTVTVTGAFTGPAVGVVLTTAVSCPAQYTTTVTAPAVSVAGGSPTKVNDTTATFVVPTGTALNKYNICAYAGTTPTSNLVHATTPTLSYVVTGVSTVAPVSGPSGGGNSVSLTVPAAAPLNVANSVVFTPKANSCPSVYGTPAAGTFATITPTAGSTTAATFTVPLAVAGSLAAATPYTACIYSSATTVGATTQLASVSSAVYNVSLPAVTLNNSIGGPGTLTPPPTVLVSSTTNFLTGVSAPQALFQVATCPGIYVATATFVNPVLKTANNRAAVTVPAGVTVAAGPVYNLCIYNSDSTTTGRLIANTTYTAATPPVLTAVTPGGGNAMGGDTITVTGSGFPTTSSQIRATLGGVALTNINAVDANTFTGVTAMHAAENDVALTVTTDTGTTTKTAAFDYLAAVTVTPNTASNNSDGVWVDVKGVGFESLGFDTNAFSAPADTEARVWLVDAEGGACAGTPVVCANTGIVPAGSGAFTKGPSAECQTPAVISGNELFCKLDLKTGALITTSGLGQVAAADKIVPNGTYSLVVVNNGSPNVVLASFSQSIISSGSTFTVADF